MFVLGVLLSLSTVKPFYLWLEEWFSDLALSLKLRESELWLPREMLYCLPVRREPPFLSTSKLASQPHIPAAITTRSPSALTCIPLTPAQSLVPMGQLQPLPKGKRHSGDIKGIRAGNFILEKFSLHFCSSWNFQRRRDLRSCTIHFWACSDPNPHPPTAALAAEYT